MQSLAVVASISHTMNASGTVAGWLSVVVTTVGLTSLISQATVMTDMMDPFHDTRSMLYLGVWFQRQPQFPFYKIVKPPPLGPVLTAHHERGFCGLKTVYLSRVPQGQAGLAGWAVLLSVVHPKGFPGAHSGRHLYNMLGGRVYEVDWLRADLLQAHDPDPENALKLILDSTETDKKVEMFVGKEEQKVLAQAMDCFPWSSLSYSIHRGLRDILVAFSKSRMNRHRAELANILHSAVKQHTTELEAKGWESKFVSDYMADMAAAAVSADKGDSGDSVRVVTDIAMCIAQTSDAKKLDVTEFWTSERENLGTMDVVALVKCFILEWSTDFDYQMYHDLPLTMEFA
ncbi:hypothetical protein D6C86_10229 [Aureobasidium pullulans]|nr:hypothetical protein D6C86_10229 [Aureobasidium pullulans]